MENQTDDLIEGQRAFVVVLSVGPGMGDGQFLVSLGTPLDITVKLNDGRQAIARTVLLTVDQLRDVAYGITSALAKFDSET